MKFAVESIELAKKEREKERKRERKKTRKRERKRERKQEKNEQGNIDKCCMFSFILYIYIERS